MNLVFRFAEGAFASVFEASILASVLILLLAVVHWTMGRKLGPSWRFALWGIVLVRLLLPTAPESKFSLFNARGWFLKEQAPPRIASASSSPIFAPELAADTAPFGNAFKVAQEPPAQVEREIPWRAGIILLWAAGTLFFLARLGLGTLWLTWRVRKMGRHASHPAAEVILERAANDIGARWRAQLIECDLVSSPAVFGLLRPKLLVPRGLLGRLSAAELRHVFLHELAHLRRGDLFVNLLMVVAQAVHWMNPLVWLVMRQMRVERELACDEMALRVVHEGEPRAYGETILRLLEGVQVRRTLPALVGIAEEKHSARKRLAQIAVFNPGRKRRGVVGVALAATVALCGLTNAKTDTYRNNEDAALREAPEIHTLVERLMNDTKRKMETGELEAAEMNLKEAKKLAPNHREVQFYLRLLEERRYGKETNEKRGSKDEAESWSPVPTRVAQANPYARTNRIDSSPGRQAIVRKLQEIRMEYYSVPEPVKLSEVIKDIDRTARKLDPEKKGVNFILSAQLENGVTPTVEPTSGVASVKVGDYQVEITPALRDVTLLGLVDAIMHVAVPPKGYENAPRLKYAVEDYGVVIGLRGNEREQLYTRTFKINPNTFLQGLDLKFDQQMLQGADEQGRLSRVQQAVRAFFQAAGIDFSTNHNVSVFPDGTVPPQRAIFYNDRTGILMVRASLSDLALIEKAVQALDAKMPQQVVFTVEFVEVKTLGELAELLGEVAEGGQFTRTSITSAEFRELKQRAEGMFQIEKMPRVSTLEGRPARVGIEGRGDIDLNSYYDDGEKTIEINAKWFTEAEKHSPPTSGIIYDGQTFLLLPKESQRHTQQELRRRYGLKPEELPLKDGRVGFITVDVIDPAGNKVNTTDEFIQKTSSSVPKQRR